MKLERIRIEFDMEQDRLLMLVLIDGGAEVRLWLTRRCVKRFWMAMVRMAEFRPEVQLQTTPEARTAVLQFQHEKALREVRFSRTEPETPSAPPRTQPLGGVPLLVTRIQARREPDGRTLLALLPTEGQGAHLTLSETLLHGLMKLVQQAVGKAEWDMTLELPKVEAPEDSAEVPRVLN
ncbi:MAG: hypothetical protein GC151_15750 [Betaproteobacteria bacterium]|nr:hypothetical protein [Betaproteobacteria bacterium]